jgi:hypothetical protein
VKPKWKRYKWGWFYWFKKYRADPYLEGLGTVAIATTHQQENWWDYGRR